MEITVKVLKQVLEGVPDDYKLGAIVTESDASHIAWLKAREHIEDKEEHMGRVVFIDVIAEHKVVLLIGG